MAPSRVGAMRVFRAGVLVALLLRAQPVTDERE